MFVSGDVIFFVYSEGAEQVQTGGVVIALDDALLTVALPHGIELINMRSPVFGRGWIVEHALRAMTPVEAEAYSRDKLRQLRARARARPPAR